MSGIARYVQHWDGRSDGDARVYRLDPPLQFRNWDGSNEGATEYVIVSAVPFVDGLALLNNPDGTAETYIFAAHRDDGERGFEVTEWVELSGSFQGEMNHQRALSNAGYELQEVRAS